MTLESILRTLRKVMRFWPWVLAAAILTAPVGALYGRATYSQRYHVNIVLAVGAQSIELGEEKASSSINELINLSNTYAGLLHTDQFHSAVVRALPFQLYEWQVADALSVDIPKGTALIKIGVTLDSPERVTQLSETVQHTLLHFIKTLYYDDRLVWIEGYSKPVLLDAMKINERMAIYAAIGAAVGAGVGACFALILSLLDKRVWDFDECMQKTGLHIMGALQATNNDSTNSSAGASAESTRSMRILAAALHVRMSGRGNCVVVVGPTELCGVNAVGAHLCEAFARQGKSVLLIDMENQLSRGRSRHSARTLPSFVEASVLVAARADTEREMRYAVDALRTAAEWSISRTSAPDGSVYNRLVFSSEFKKLSVQQKLAVISHARSSLREDYDVLILTTPALLVHDEVLLAVGGASEVLPVFRYKKTTTRQVELTLSRLQGINITPRGCIWTNVNKRLMKRLY